MRALDAAENHGPTGEGGGYFAQLAQGDLLALVQENNALRRNNERLTKANADLRRRLGIAESSARTASTMATAYRIEARGGDYDATKEEAP